MELRDLVRLDRKAHDRSAFSCGKPSLDEWLKQYAGQSDDRDGTATWVLLDGPKVVAYYSICTWHMECEVAPSGSRAGRYPVPGLLVARLAVDRKWAGQGLGSLLLLHALGVAVEVADRAGMRILAVDALNEGAAQFYERSGFTPLEARPLTLYLPIEDIRVTLAAMG